MKMHSANKKLDLSLFRCVGLERPMLARFPVPIFVKTPFTRPPSREVMGLAKGINFERGRGCVIGEDPIVGISTIEYV